VLLADMRRPAGNERARNAEEEAAKETSAD